MDSQLIPKIVNSFWKSECNWFIDVKNHYLVQSSSFWRDNTGVDPLLWAANLENMGVGEILLTSINHDGEGGKVMIMNLQKSN